jgi:hypothetical protein
MLPAVTGEDELRWAQARSLLDRVPTQPAGERLRRWRRRRVLVLVALLVVGGAFGAVLAVLLGDPDPTRDTAVPVWRAVTGYTSAAGGLVLQLTGVVLLWRGARRLRLWSSPLSVLTSPQRRQLLAVVRGRRPVEPERLPLARLLAEQLVHQRAQLVASTGLGILFTGSWIAEQTTTRLVVVLVWLVVALVTGPLLARDARRARRFLDRHGTGPPGPATARDES